MTKDQLIRKVFCSLGLDLIWFEPDDQDCEYWPVTEDERLYAEEYLRQTGEIAGPRP